MASIYYQDITCIHDTTLNFREINIPTKIFSLKNQTPDVTMKRPVVECAMVRIY